MGRWGELQGEDCGLKIVIPRLWSQRLWSQDYDPTSVVSSISEMGDHADERPVVVESSSLTGKRCLSIVEDTSDEATNKRKRRKVGNPLLMFVQDELFRNREEGSTFGLEDLEREYQASLESRKNKKIQT